MAGLRARIVRDFAAKLDKYLPESGDLRPWRTSVRTFPELFVGGKLAFFWTGLALPERWTRKVTPGVSLRFPRGGPKGHTRPSRP